MGAVHSPSACKGRGSLDAQIEFILAAKMKVTIAICAFLVSFAIAKERKGKEYYHATRAHPPPPPPVVEHHYHKPAPKCHVVYEPKFVEKCKKIQRRPYKPCVEYRKEYQTKCYIQEKTCHPITTTVPDDACHTQNEKHCTVEVKTTYDVSYQEKCENIEHKVCQQSQVVGDYKRPAVVGHPVIGKPVRPVHPIIEARAGPLFGAAPVYSNKRRHKRASKSRNGSRNGKSYHQPLPLLARRPKCQVKVERNCHKVPVKVPRHIEIPHCTKVPHLKCIPSFRTITDQACHHEPKEVCREVEVEVPYDVPVEYCPSVFEEVCQKVPSGKVATEVCHPAKY